ncbi:MAG: hypothetical protein KAS01_00750 [Candidatus Pacebacteria bacterium]|nr:hypothetical protein [Candidatus Paceibacterota bacterium]
MKTKNYLIGIFLSVGLFAFVSVVGAANWDPLVKIPGIPTTGINLSTYLVGLYNFMLSVVGIVAVMMLIVAGMRYITAAGNAASVTDAKSIAGNAVVGLLLALLSFVILKTINPDVLYLKKPGSNFAVTPTTDLGSCGSYDAGVCTCVNGATPAAADAAACDTACEASPELCEAAPKNVCLDPNFTTSPNDKECHCLNGYTYEKGTYASCQDFCSAPSNNDNSASATNTQTHPACIRLDLTGTINDDPKILFTDIKTNNSSEVLPATTITVFDSLNLKSSLKDPLNYFISPYRYYYYIDSCVDDNNSNPQSVMHVVPEMANPAITNKSDTWTSVDVNFVNNSTNEIFDCLPFIVIFDSNLAHSTTGQVRIKIAPNSWHKVCQEGPDCKSGICNVGICTLF